MTCSIRSEFYSVQFYCLMVVNRFNFKESFFDITLIKKLLVWKLPRDLHKILKHIVINAFSWVGHVNLPLKICFFNKIRQAGAMVNVEVSDKQELDVFRVDLVEVR